MMNAWSLVVFLSALFCESIKVGTQNNPCALSLSTSSSPSSPPPPFLAGYTISPDNIWVLEVGRQYQITVHVFDKFNHPILVTQVNSALHSSHPGKPCTPF